MQDRTVPAPAEGMPEISRLMDTDGAFANLANLVAMMHWQALGNMRRVDDPEGSYYRMPKAEAEQLLSLLYVAEGFAGQIVGSLDR